MKNAPRIFRLLFGCFGLLAGAACTSTSPPNRALPVTVSFAMDKAGNTARIDFSVVEGQTDLKRRFMVGLNFPKTQDGSVERIIQQKDVPVHVEVFSIDHGTRTPIPTQDDGAIVAAANGVKIKKTGSLANVHLHAHDGETSYALIAGFYLSHYGRYVAVVRTVKNQPMFENIKTKLKVDEFYNTGE